MWIAEFNAAHCLDTRTNKWKYLIFNGIKYKSESNPTTIANNRCVYNHTLVSLCFDGLENIFLFINMYLYMRNNINKRSIFYWRLIFLIFAIWLYSYTKHSRIFLFILYIQFLRVGYGTAKEIFPFFLHYYIFLSRLFYIHINISVFSVYLYCAKNKSASRCILHTVG